MIERCGSRALSRYGRRNGLRRFSPSSLQDTVLAIHLSLPRYMTIGIKKIIHVMDYKNKSCNDGVLNSALGFFIPIVISPVFIFSNL